MSGAVAARIGGLALLVHAAVAAINLSPLMDSYTVSTLLDVNREGTLVVWLSSSALLAIAAMCAVAAARAGSGRSGWWVLAVAFAALSADETASLHERAGELANGILQVSWLPGLYLWVAVAAPIGLAFAVWMGRWFGRTVGWASPVTRLVLAGLAAWVVVPVLEALDPISGGSRLLIVAEESLEAVGQVLVGVGLLVHLGGRERPLPSPG